MERLSGLDASFLYGETPETPTHTAPLWIFDPVPEGKSPFQSFREHIKARLHLLPFFHRKLVLSPIQVHFKAEPVPESCEVRRLLIAQTPASVAASLGLPTVQSCCSRT